MAHTEMPGGVDWCRVIDDLQKTSMNTRQIASKVFVSHATILAWKKGTQPRHSDGERLLALWWQVTDKTRGNLPAVCRLQS